MDVPRENIHNVLKHAQQVEMLSEYHDYIFTSLDLHTVDLEEFQYGGTNISSFSIIDQLTEDYQEIMKDWYFSQHYVQKSSFSSYDRSNEILHPKV